MGSEESSEWYSGVILGPGWSTMPAIESKLGLDMTSSSSSPSGLADGIVIKGLNIKDFDRSKAAIPESSSGQPCQE